MQFREYGDGQIYLEVRTDDEVKPMAIDISGVRVQSSGNLTATAAWGNDLLQRP